MKTIESLQRRLRAKGFDPGSMSLAQSARSEERGIPKRDHLVRLPALEVSI